MRNKLQLFVSTIIFLLFVAAAKASEIVLTFLPRGTATTIDSVVVQNLTENIKKTVFSGNTLLLIDTITDEKLINSDNNQLYIYPNPLTEYSTVSFNVLKPGIVRISVFSIDGNNVVTMNKFYTQGKKSVRLTLSKGIYLLNVIGNGFNYKTKVVSCVNSQTKAEIDNFVSNSMLKDMYKVKQNDNTIAYNPSDQLLLTAYSGNCSSTIEDVNITGDKTISFAFDACDNNSTANIDIKHTQKKYIYFSTPYYNKSYFEASSGIINKVDSNGLKIKCNITNEFGVINVGLSVGYMYKTSNMTMFMSPGSGNSFLLKGLYKYNEVNNTWFRVLKLDEEQWIWSIDEDSYGNIYAGVYLTKGDNYRNFPAIFKSSDGGDTWTLLFDLFLLPQQFNHIHGIAIDKKTNRMYISVGDKGQVGNLISDYPYLEFKSANLIDGQTTKVLVTKNSRIWGSDATGYCRIYRTTDDKTYNIVYNSTYKNIFELRQSDLSGYLYAAVMLDVSIGSKLDSVQILVSKNDGITWSTLVNVDNLYGGLGFRKMSQFEKGRAFVILYNADNKMNEEYMIEEKMNSIKLSKFKDIE